METDVGDPKTIKEDYLSKFPAPGEMGEVVSVNPQTIDQPPRTEPIQNRKYPGPSRQPA
jgi:hypothetical protein